VILDKTSIRIADDGGTARLSPAEFIIMENLFRAQGSFVTTDALISCVWRNTDREPSDPLKLLTVFIWRIRKKMARIGTTAKIESGWRLGYRLA
jgi:DNA-binding response OmpR family regulator